MFNTCRGIIIIIICILVKLRHYVISVFIIRVKRNRSEVGNLVK